MTAQTEAPVEATTPDQLATDDDRKDKVDQALSSLGLTREDMEKYKSGFGRVSMTWIDEKPYIYRPLFRRELRQLRDPQAMQGATELHMEERVCALCILAPKLNAESMTQSRAGVASTLAALIYNISGFDIDATPIEL